MRPNGTAFISAAFRAFYATISDIAPLTGSSQRRLISNCATVAPQELVDGICGARVVNVADKHSLSRKKLEREWCGVLDNARGLNLLRHQKVEHDQSLHFTTYHNVFW